jgi:hypothetical protein
VLPLACRLSLVTRGQPERSQEVEKHSLQPLDSLHSASPATRYRAIPSTNSLAVTSSYISPCASRQLRDRICYSTVGWGRMSHGGMWPGGLMGAMSVVMRKKQKQKQKGTIGVGQSAPEWGEQGMCKWSDMGRYVTDNLTVSANQPRNAS